MTRVAYPYCSRYVITLVVLTPTTDLITFLLLEVVVVVVGKSDQGVLMFGSYYRSRLGKRKRKNYRCINHHVGSFSDKVGTVLCAQVSTMFRWAGE